jgi:hypothetical protein
MDIDSTIGYKQSRTIQLGNTVTSDIDGNGEIWQLADALTSPNLEARRMGVKSLVEIKAHFNYPLVAYILATRLADSDLELRAQVTKAILDILFTQETGNHTLEACRIRLAEYVSQMRTRGVFALLQLAESGLISDDNIAKILNYNPFAGVHLAKIVSDWQMPVSIRKKAAVIVGLVGYMDAIPVLQRIFSRLESRYSGKQISMWNIDENGEASLLPIVKDVLTALQAP